MSTVITSTPSAVAAVGASATLKRVEGWIAGVVGDLHKEAAYVMGVLTVFGVTPVPANQVHWTSALLLGYAGITHAAEKLGLRLPTAKTAA